MITTMFKNDDMFSDGCITVNDTINCNKRDQDFNDIYFISILCMNIGAFVFGILGDKIGAVSVAVLAFIFGLTGFSLLMFVEENEHFIWIGTVSEEFFDSIKN